MRTSDCITATLLISVTAMNSESPSNRLPHVKKTKGFKNKFKILLGFGYVLLLILVMVISLPVYLFRLLVILLAKTFRPDLGNILNGLSSYYVNDYFHKKLPRANVVISVFMQGRDMSAKELKEVLMEKWIDARDNQTGKLKFEQFQQYPERWLGFTFFKSYAETFNINDHVYIHDKPSTKMEFASDDDITNICEKFLNGNYKPCRSPWEIHLVKNYKSNKTETFHPDHKTYVAIFKIHHCLADGYSMLSALVEVFGQQNLTDIKTSVPTLPKRSIGQKIFDCVCFPFTVVYECSYLSSHLFRLSPWKIQDENKMWYQHCAKSDFIPIEKVKFIKNKFDVSFTSVLLYAISSATSKSLQNVKTNKLNTTAFKCFLEDEGVNSIYCGSMLPLPGRSTGLTNHATMALFDLPIGHSGRVKDKLCEVDHMLKINKKSHLPYLLPLYFKLVGSLFYPMGKIIGKQKMISTGLTNFPSVPFQIERNDRKCIAADFLVGGLDGVMGVAVMVLSYGEYIRIGVTAEKAAMSKDEITEFKNYMIDEIDHLYSEASLQDNNRNKNVSIVLHQDGTNESLHTLPIQVV